MTHLMLLIPLSIVMGLVGLGAFLWALRNGQFEDPVGNSCRVLIPRDPPGEDGPRDDMPETRTPGDGAGP